MNKVLNSCLNPPDVQSDLHGLVRAHDDVRLVLPAVFQRAAASLLGVERSEVLGGLVVVRGDLVGEDVHVVHFKTVEDLRGEAEALKGEYVLYI